MDLTAIRDEVRLRYGISAADALFTDANLTVFINTALRRFNLDQDWPWMTVTTTANTVSGISTLTLASDVRRIMRISYKNKELRYISARAQSDFFDISGAPSFYTYDGNAGWLLYPTPDAIYTIDYVYVRTDDVLTAETDTPYVPDYAIDAIIAFVCVMLANRERNMELSGHFFAEYASIMDVLRDEQRKTIEGMSPRRTRVEDRATISYTSSS